jgi:hydroxymethylpyrimidine/phosphomethylpyrimidine kinase
VAVSKRNPPHAMTIAGSDSGGGAGIQADLKTFAAFRVYGTSAITAITAQNTVGVSAVQEVSLDVIAAQIDAIVNDIGVDVVKTGMLSSAGIVRLVAVKAKEHSFPNLVVDPVMIAATGARLLREEAVKTICEELIPLATVVTPNIPEAEALTGLKIDNRAGMERAAQAIHRMGARNVVVKGGHMESSGDSDDLLFDGHRFKVFSAKRINTTSNHGTGCTFASAVASGLAHGRPVEQAVADAKAYVTRAIVQAFPVGKGHGPLNHFHEWWK